MFFKQFYLGCLAHASYLIGSGKDAAVIDPQRDVEEYIAAAADAGMRIRYIFETHVHADFVSGHRELAERTGAEIVFGWRADATLAHRRAHDGDVFAVGSLKIEVIETPGHTPEGISLLVSDSASPELASKLFTGDTVFVGDVGRPDLVGSKGYGSEEMASMLYDSVQRLLQLDDATELYPAHGAGSLCGRNISKDTSSTVGAQRAENYALQPMAKDEFVQMMIRGLPEQPAYFAIDADLNRRGVPALDLVARPPALTPAETSEAAKAGSLLLDVRPSEEFAAAHISGSMNIGLDGQFASWAGTLVPFTRSVVLIANDEGEVDEAVTRLARIGFSSVGGYLYAGIAAWKEAGFATSSTPQISVDELRLRLQADPKLQLLDVRRPGEFDSGAAPNAISIPLTDLEDRIGALDPARTLHVICGTGYRSMIAASLLEAVGFRDVVDVLGGMAEYSAAGYRIVVPQAV
jgi:hydroxyacylglutathione hydrolase